MANGDLGGGLGTLASPFEVWDIPDLNALRGLTTSAAEPIYVNFKADIDFAGSSFEGHFNTIRFGRDTATANSYDYVNIDGENHVVRNFKQTGNSNDACGFFGPIFGEIKNLSLLNCDVNSTSSSISHGVLCRNITSTNIENIKITGTLTIQGYVSGLAHGLNSINTTTPCMIQNCEINLKVINKSSSGFNGYCFQSGSNNILSFYKCVSACNVYNEVTGGNLSGFVGNTSGTMIFDSCISHCKFIVLAATPQFTGVVAGFRATTNSITMSFKNCISKCSFIGRPPSTATNMASFAPAHTSNAVQCYSICDYDLRDATANIRGGDDTILFDWEASGLPLTRFTDSTNGLTTAELKSQAFLQSRGWTF